MTPVDRRMFLRHSGTAASAILAGGLLPSTVLGANDRVRVAVMGVNGRGSALAKGFARQPNTVVEYLCDVDQQSLDRAAGELEKETERTAKLEGDVRRILDDGNVDALVIAAPDHWHATAAVWACAAGKHVYVEKPACHNGAEGELMVAAAEKYGRAVQLGTQRRSSPGVRTAIDSLRNGAIGNVLFARGWINSTRPSIGFGQMVKVPPRLDFGLWQGPAPEKPYQDNLVHYNWHWFWHWGTGELGNNGIHALDICRLGLDVEYPEKVVCGGGKLHFHDDQETPDTQIASFHFGDKMINWEHRTWHRRGFENSLFGMQFYGEEGTLQLTNGSAAILDMDEREVRRFPTEGGEKEHLANFLAAIRNGEPLNADIREGVISTAMCHLGNIAYRCERTVRFDPLARAVLDDSEAAKLWTRQYRPGWELTIDTGFAG